MSHQRITIEASELGLKPGEWPEHLTFEGVVLQRTQPILTAEGELTAVSYVSRDYILIVFND